VGKHLIAQLAPVPQTIAQPASLPEGLLVQRAPLPIQLVQAAPNQPQEHPINGEVAGLHA